MGLIALVGEAASGLGVAVNTGVSVAGGSVAVSVGVGGIGVSVGVADAGRVGVALKAEMVSCAWKVPATRVLRSFVSKTGAGVGLEILHASEASTKMLAAARIFALCLMFIGQSPIVQPWFHRQPVGFDRQPPQGI